MPRIRKIYTGALLKRRERLRREYLKKRKSLGNQPSTIRKVQHEAFVGRLRKAETDLARVIPKSALVHKPKAPPEENWKEFQQLSEHERRIARREKHKGKISKSDRPPRYPLSLKVMRLHYKRAERAVKEVNQLEAETFRKINKRHGVKIKVERHGLKIDVTKQANKKSVSGALILARRALARKRTRIARAIDAIEGVRLSMAIEEDTMLLRAEHDIISGVERDIDHATRGYLEMLTGFLEEIQEGEIRTGKTVLNELKSK